MTFEITKVQEEVLIKVMGTINPFSSLKGDELLELVYSSTKVLAKKHNKIYIAGDTPSEFFVLIEGAVKISTSDKENKDVIHELINSRSIFGLADCCVSSAVKNTATCLSSVVSYYSIPFKKIQALMLNNFEFNLSLLSYLSESIKKKEERVEQLMLTDARSRVTKFIKDTALKNGIRVGYEVLLKHNFTQQDMADFTGTSRQTVTNILKELKDANMIHIERKTILIRDILNFK